VLNVYAVDTFCLIAPLVCVSFLHCEVLGNRGVSLGPCDPPPYSRDKVLPPLCASIVSFPHVDPFIAIGDDSVDPSTWCSPFVSPPPSHSSCLRRDSFFPACPVEGSTSERNQTFGLPRPFPFRYPLHVSLSCFFSVAPQRPVLYPLHIVSLRF